jgi:hypothetical protein
MRQDEWPNTGFAVYDVKYDINDILAISKNVVNVVTVVHPWQTAAAVTEGLQAHPGGFPERAAFRRLTMDALYFRVSSNRQTTENQFDDVLQAAERDDRHGDWSGLRGALASAVYQEDQPARTGKPVYRIRPEVAAALARQFVYIEQGRSSKRGARRRSVFEQMARDASARKFTRLLL